MRAWLRRWFGFRPAERAQVVKALTPMVPPPQTRVSWTVHRHRGRVKSIEDWNRIHGQERAS